MLAGSKEKTCPFSKNTVDMGKASQNVANNIRTPSEQIVSGARLGTKHPHPIFPEFHLTIINLRKCFS
jgi:hypothetical protein